MELRRPIRALVKGTATRQGPFVAFHAWLHVSVLPSEEH